jgi:hypothetical protein
MQEGILMTVPWAHYGWTRLVPTESREGRWAIHSMLWVKKELEAEQVTIASPDMTGVVIRTGDRKVLVVSVYIPPTDQDALRGACDLLRAVVNNAQRGRGEMVDVMLVGDFNQHDQLWGGEDVTFARQREATAIIDLMSDCSLQSLLPQGTKTWEKGASATTIDLVLASSSLARQVSHCATADADYGSDHRAIETTIDMDMSNFQPRERLLFRNAPWKGINERIVHTLETLSMGETVQQKTDYLMWAVSEAVHALTPKAKASPYAKRW